MKELHELDAIQLFSWHAFHMRQTPKDYQDMSSHVVRYAKGLPLALKVIGSNLADKNLDEWRPILEMYDQIPENTIHEVLKISYDCLPDGAKSFFLDLACFFTKVELESVEEILEACNSGAKFYIEFLVRKSLLDIDRDGFLWMHDLVKNMGKEIVRREAPSNPSERSRLWYYKDILKVLHEDLGNNKIEGIMFDPPQHEVVQWNGLPLKKMKNLRILMVRNAQFSTDPEYFPNNLRLLEWEGYPWPTLPSDFSAEKLVFVNLRYSLFELERSLKRFEHVTYMDFSHCELITEVPDMSQCLSLKRLLLEECHNLIKVHDSVGFLSNLTDLDVSRCTKLSCFPQEIKLPSLQKIYLSGCKRLAYFPRILGKMDSLTRIFADGSAIKELPSSVSNENLPRLETLVLRSCKSLNEIPCSLFTFQNLSYLDLSEFQPRNERFFGELMLQSQSVISCTNLHVLELKNCGPFLDEDLHLLLKIFPNLENLNLSSSDIESIPECIKDFDNLMTLDVNDCKRLRDIPELPSNLIGIRAENCTSLTEESLDRLWSQVKHSNNFPYLEICMPATTFPGWFDYSCKGCTLSFRCRENVPDIALAFEVGKADTSRRQHFIVSVSINGSKIHREEERCKYGSTEGHVLLFGLGSIGNYDEWAMLDNFLEMDWNDVEIEFTTHDPPDMCIVNCGVYVLKALEDEENDHFDYYYSYLRFKNFSLKRKAIASPPNNEPPKKRIRMCKASDKGKLTTNTKKRTRRIKRRPFRHPHKGKLVFPMKKIVCRFLNY